MKIKVRSIVFVMLTLSIFLLAGCMQPKEEETPYVLYPDGVTPSYGALNDAQLLQSIKPEGVLAYFYEYDAEALANYFLALKDVGYEQEESGEKGTYLFRKDDFLVTIVTAASTTAIDITLPKGYELPEMENADDNDDPLEIVKEENAQHTP